ncbi:MAG: hypothetical protein O2819_03790 [Planctomycetota bacterium]|nr:hypothetical protein [Planctomycetota bacterium]MDA1105552.1 hypothetical protein [Planctomycetota bacterium]
MSDFRIYKEDGDQLMEVPSGATHLKLIPAGNPREVRTDRGVRIMWGQHLLTDIVHGHYRTLICGVNDTNNEHGILGEILRLVPTSQWTLRSATSYAKMFREATALHAHEDREPYILKFDLDRLLVLAMLRPAGRDHFTLEDIYRGMSTATGMLDGRRERLPVATVSFLGAKSNALRGERHAEPSFESVLDAMWKAGFRGDIYPPVASWDKHEVGVFATYPFPESVDRMRQGSS